MDRKSERAAQVEEAAELRVREPRLPVAREPRARVVLRFRRDRKSERAARVEEAAVQRFGSSVCRWRGNLGQGLSFVFEGIESRSGRRGGGGGGARVSGAESAGGREPRARIAPRFQKDQKSEPAEREEAAVQGPRARVVLRFQTDRKRCGRGEHRG